MTTATGMTTRSGWSEAETETLFSLARDAQAANRPLKRVFDEMAVLTGRKPNSVRNYYYARVKESGGEPYAHQRAFQPFSGEETARLVEAVLSAQAAGESVRRCTLRMAGGDDRAMLRYQNKYRSVLKNNPDLVRLIMEQLRSAGKPVFDPYALPVNRTKPGRPRKEEAGLHRTAAKLIGELGRVPGLNLSALLDALGALAVSAARASAPSQEAGVSGGALRAENAALKAQLARQHERYRTLLNYFTRLMRINSEFLSQNSVGKAQNLSNYIRDLESSVKNCQHVVTEAVR